MLMVCNTRELITYLETRLAFAEKQCVDCPQHSFSSGWAFGSAHAFREAIDGLKALTPQGVTTIPENSVKHPERK